MVSSVKVWTVKSGDNLPSISAAVYGDPRLWRLIADANDISNPLKFPDRVNDLGRVLMIPERRQ